MEQRTTTQRHSICWVFGSKNTFAYDPDNVHLRFCFPSNSYSALQLLNYYIIINLTSIWEQFKISNAVENYLQQEITEIEGCFQTPAQSVSVNSIHSTNWVSYNPHKHVGSDKWQVRPQSLRTVFVCLGHIWTQVYGFSANGQ